MKKNNMDKELYILAIKRTAHSGYGNYDDVICAVKASDEKEALEKMTKLLNE